MTTSLHSDLERSGAARWVWIGFVVLSSVALSRVFACATPFAALAAFAALTLRPRDGVALVGSAWLVNQAVGFGLLHYPWTGSTFGWGLAIGVAALSGFGVALFAAARGPRSPAVAVPLALLAAFAAYELVLFAATWALPSGSDAFSLATVARIFAIDAVALGLLLVADRLAGGPGRAPAAPRGRVLLPGVAGLSDGATEVGPVHYRATLGARTGRPHDA